MNFSEVQAKVVRLQHALRVWSYLHDELDAFMDPDIGQAKMLEHRDTCAVRFVPKELFYSTREEIRDRMDELEKEIAKLSGTQLQADAPAAQRRSLGKDKRVR